MVENRITEVINKAAEDRMWGEIVIVFRDGAPTMIRRIETIPLENGGPNDRQKRADKGF